MSTTSGDGMAAALRRRLAGAALLLLLDGTLHAQLPPAPTPPAGGPQAAPAAPVSRYLPNRFAGKAGRYYRTVWGVDTLGVKLVESGELVRFTWRVLDPRLAAVLHDKQLEPTLVDPGAGVSLVVPALEKIGQLRQGATPEAGRSYWMAFSNRGHLVRKGDRVNVVVGNFHADGLMVD